MLLSYSTMIHLYRNFQQIQAEAEADFRWTFTSKWLLVYYSSAMVLSFEYEFISRRPNGAMTCYFLKYTSCYSLLFILNMKICGSSLVHQSNYL